jgi:hypothetical protein
MAAYVTEAGFGDAPGIVHVRLAVSRPAVRAAGIGDHRLHAPNRRLVQMLLLLESLHSERQGIVGAPPQERRPLVAS